MVAAFIECFSFSQNSYLLVAGLQINFDLILKQLHYREEKFNVAIVVEIKYLKLFAVGLLQSSKLSKVICPKVGVITSFCRLSISAECHEGTELISRYLSLIFCKSCLPYAYQPNIDGGTPIMPHCKHCKQTCSLFLHPIFFALGSKQ